MISMAYLQGVLIVGAVILCSTLWIRYKNKKSNKKNPHGPVGFPFIGILSQLGKFNVIHKTLTAMGKRYGRSFHFKVLGKNMVVLRSVSIVEQAFTDDRLTDRKETFFQRYIFKGKGFAFANYANYVQELRKVFHTALYWRWDNHHSNESVVHEGINKMVSKMLATKSQDFDPENHMKNLMTDIFSVELIGETLPEADPDRNAMWELIDVLYMLLDPSVDAPLQMFPFLRFLPIKHGRLFRDAIKARDRVSKRYFDSQKETYTEGQIRGLVDVCLKIQQGEIKEKGENWLTDDYIKGLMYDTIAAGMTELMKSIRMLILLMCHHQDIQSRVYAEINDVIGSSCDVRATDKEQMPYTGAVIMEMLRYVSQTPLAIPHKCNKDITIDGYEIEKNSGIFPNLWSIHHDEEVWGDPWCFRPDRFLTSEGTMLPKDHKLRRTLIPFSVGRRRCPGEDFAMSGLFILFTTMLQRVQFLPPLGEELPTADTRMYNNKYPLYEPVFKCRAVSREES